MCSTVCYACYHGVIKVETLSNPVSSCNPNPRLNPVTTLMFLSARAGSSTGDATPCDRYLTSDHTRLIQPGCRFYSLASTKLSMIEVLLRYDIFTKKDLHYQMHRHHEVVLVGTSAGLPQYEISAIPVVLCWGRGWKRD